LEWDHRFRSIFTIVSFCLFCFVCFVCFVCLLRVFSFSFLFFLLPSLFYSIDSIWFNSLVYFWGLFGWS
jgi:hypothetical protein